MPARSRLRNTLVFVRVAAFRLVNKWERRGKAAEWKRVGRMCEVKRLSWFSSDVCRSGLGTGRDKAGAHEDRLGATKSPFQVVLLAVRDTDARSPYSCMGQTKTDIACKHIRHLYMKAFLSIFPSTPSCSLFLCQW